MKKLEEEIKIQNRTLHLLKRTEGAAIYELRNAGGLLYGYEVVRIKIHPAQTIHGKEYPIREGLPANEEWGTYGLSFGRNFKNDALAVYQAWALKPPVSRAETDLGASEGHHSGKEQI